MIVTHKKLYTFSGITFVMMLPMLERLKQSFSSGLITITVNIDLLKKESRMSFKSVYIHTIFKIATKVLTIESHLT